MSLLVYHLDTLLKVTLTERGLALLKAYCGERRVTPALSGMVLLTTTREFAQVFGPHLGIGDEPVIEHGTLEIVSKLELRD